MFPVYLAKIALLSWCDPAGVPKLGSVWNATVICMKFINFCSYIWCCCQSIFIHSLQRTQSTVLRTNVSSRAPLQQKNGKMFPRKFYNELDKIKEGICVEFLQLDAAHI